jgi:hypothetical protein
MSPDGLFLGDGSIVHLEGMACFGPQLRVAFLAPSMPTSAVGLGKDICFVGYHHGVRKTSQFGIYTGYYTITRWTLPVKMKARSQDLKNRNIHSERCRPHADGLFHPERVLGFCDHWPYFRWQIASF